MSELNRVSQAAPAAPPKCKTTMCNGKKLESVSTLDFIDIGASKGGSYKHIQKKFGMKNGIAIDLDEEKVAISNRNSVPAIRLDATNMRLFNNNSAKLISIIHTLEHLPDLSIIDSVLKECIRVATTTVYIKGPMFYDAYLRNLGLRFYWSHWRGHTCHIEPNKIIQIMKKHGVTNYRLGYISPVSSSSDTVIHPINGLIDRHHYDPKKDPPKRMNVPLKGIYKEFELIFTL